jgi:anthranilate phosphoribosyltransferase
VAKHGNRSASSKSGSADVLEALGVSLELSPEQTARCIDEIGLGFCFAPRLHAAMKSAAPVRQQLGFRTIFNLLGPLTNPANAEYQLIGTGRTHLAELLAEALAQLGTQRALVVCGNDELDEVSLWGETAVFVVESSHVRRETWSPAQLGLPESDVAALRVASPAESATVIRQVLSGESGPPRDIVLANTAAALVACQLAATPSDGVARARAAIDSGGARNLLDQFAQRTQELADVNH